MSVKANWPFHVCTPQTDVFAQVRVEQVGAPIDLRDDVALLNQRVVALVNRESELYAAGVTCEVKDMADTACSACPAHGSRGELCQVGCEQERLLTALAVQRRRGAPTN